MQIEILNRTGGGRRDVFSTTPVTFGRDASNMVVLVGEHTSRHHGELRFETNQWILVNLSANGTEVGGKLITKKPRTLRDRDVIGVGGEPLFEVRITAATEVEAAAPAAAEQPERRISRRTKIWTLIGIYLLLMAGLFLFFATLKDRKPSTAQAPELTREEISKEIRRPLPPMAKDERTSHEQMLAAREIAARLDASPDALYEAYMAYKKSLALANRTEFEPGLDQLKYIDLQNQLVEDVSRLYAEAYEKFKSRRFREAEDSFRKLMQIYPDTSSVIHENAEKHRSAAAEALSKSKRRRF